MRELGFTVSRGTSLRARSEARKSKSISLMLLRLIRVYTFYSRLRKGKLSIARLAMRLSKSDHGPVIVPTVDGRRLYADLSTGMCETLFFLGEYERAVTRMIKLVVESGDVCLDVGANFGWYTTLLHQLSGPRGVVHAFEPVSTTFATLEKNVGLLKDSTSVQIYDAALGDVPGTITMHVFAGLPNGHSSLSTMGRTDYVTVQSRMKTLDSHIEEHNLRQIDFVKVDVEGAELKLFRGAQKLFQQPQPPIWMIEMALGTSKSFGYVPNDLIVFMRERAGYDFYAVDEPSLTLKPIKGFPREDIGANVLCIPDCRYGEKFERARRRILEAGTIR